MEKLVIGMLIGGVAGALLTANNYKMRTLVRKGQEEVAAKIDKLMDEKIEQMENGLEKVKEEAAEKVETVKEKAKRAAKKTAEQ